VAVYVNGTGDAVRRTANLPSSSLFTIAGWARHVTVNTGTERPIVFFGNDFGEFRLIWRTSNAFAVNVSGANSNFSANPPTDGTWFYWGIWVSGTGASQFGGWWRDVAGNSGTVTRNSASVTVASLDICRNRAASAYYNGDVANVAVYDAALTQDEWLQNMFAYVPVARRDVLRYHWPLLDSSDTRDLSGNAWSPTLTTVDTADGPPIRWLSRVALHPFASAGASEDIAAAGTLSITGSADLDASGSLAAAGTLSVTGAADLDASGALLAAGTVSITGAADLDALGTLAATGTLSVTGAADLDALGELSAAGTLSINGDASLTGGAPIDLAADGTLSIVGAASLNASGALAAAGTVSVTGAADLDAQGALAAAGSLSVTGAADLDARGTLSAAGTVSINGSAFLADADSEDLLASGSLAISGAATLTAAGALTAAGSLSVTGSADLDSIGQLVVSGSLAITGAAAVTATGSLSAAGQIAIFGAALLIDPNAGAPHVRKSHTAKAGVGNRTLKASAGNRTAKVSAGATEHKLN
jgi:formylmethanofuran dehydrogenase subunit C